jgi:hypothetical protein
MGQDTYVDIGVSVSLEFTLKNIQFIKILLDEILKKDTAKVWCYVTGSEDCDDEVIEIKEFLENEEEFHGCLHLNQVANHIPFSDFEKLFENYKPEKEIVLRFLFETYQAYARNISRRESPTIFSNTNGYSSYCETVSVSSFIQNLNEGLEYFKKLGIPEDMICVGYTFLDSY